MGPTRLFSLTVSTLLCKAQKCILCSGTSAVYLTWHPPSLVSFFGVNEPTPPPRMFRLPLPFESDQYNHSKTFAYGSVFPASPAGRTIAAGRKYQNHSLRHTHAVEHFFPPMRSTLTYNLQNSSSSKSKSNGPVSALRGMPPLPPCTTGNRSGWW